THTRPYPKTAVNEPGATLISAITLFVAGSIRETMPFGSLGIHADPAPKASPPSVFAGPTGTLATTWFVVTSMRYITFSSQLGDQSVPAAIIKPEHGFFTGTVATTRFVCG